MESSRPGECRLCMNYRSVKPLNAEMVRRIGACFGIHINLEDSTLSRNICRRCTDKVKLVKKYRDFYLSVQAKLFIRRSNSFLRIDREPLVQVILTQRGSPRYIHPLRRPYRENIRQPPRRTDTSSSDSGTVRSRNARGSRNPVSSTARHVDPNIVNGLRATNSPRSTPINQPSTEATLPHHRESPSPAADRHPSAEVALPADAAWHTVASVDDKSELSTEPSEREDFEVIEQAQESVPEDIKPMFDAMENLELEVLETDVQSEVQDELESFEEIANMQEQENVDVKEAVVSIAIDNTQQNEFEVAGELDPEVKVGDIIIVETVEKTEDMEIIDNADEQRQTRPAQGTRRRKRGKISGRELYKSLLTDCNICGKKIERNRLEGHINRHSGRRPYSCPIEGCTSRFHCKHACRLHVRCRHGSETYACGTCGKEYKARRDLLGHIRETHVEPRFRCDICLKMFTTRSRLKQHRYYHTGERNYPCHVCSMRFFSNFQLKVHMRTHTKSFPFMCSVCNKYFRYRHMAKEHIVKDHGIDNTLQKDWVIQYPEPDPEEVEVVNPARNIVRYNIQRLEEPEEDDELGEGTEGVYITSLTTGQSEQHQELIDAE